MILIALILVALIIPRCNLVTGGSRRALCVENIRNIEMAIALWEKKTGKTMPAGKIYPDGKLENKPEYDLVPFVKDLPTFSCPWDGEGCSYFYYPLSDDVGDKGAADDWFPGVNCIAYGRPSHRKRNYPHTTYNQDPF